MNKDNHANATTQTTREPKTREGQATPEMVKLPLSFDPHRIRVGCYEIKDANGSQVLTLKVNLRALELGKLIVTAVNAFAPLLEAAKDAANELEALSKAKDSDYARPDETIIEALRAAIPKALGSVPGSAAKAGEAPMESRRKQ